MPKYSTVVHKILGITCNLHLKAWLMTEYQEVQNFKNDQPISEKFVFSNNDLTFEEIGQLYGGN